MRLSKSFLSWTLLSLILAGYYLFQFTVADEKESLLIGQTTSGHYQIELSCDSCHLTPFGGQDTLQQACVDCHQIELKQAHDSHPRKKFTDPRNADRLAILDARFCITCHREHQDENTGPMGLTLPGDYCYYCHQDIAEDRPSHKDAAFDSCANAGCHNYHDNRALYEDFLLKHSDEPWIKSGDYRLLSPEEAQLHRSNLKEHLDQTLDPIVQPDIHSHATQGADCEDCHTANEPNSVGWKTQPAIESCATCHAEQSKAFMASRHGMRIDAGLGPMTPGQARLNFKADAATQQMTCASCHQIHRPTDSAEKQEPCLQCHNDEHSRNFGTSSHSRVLLHSPMSESNTDNLMNCSSCHLPTRKHPDSYLTEHNQNAVLRPNEKMIRPVCLNCHSLEFAIDALADPNLISNNFNGKPGIHVPSIDWARASDASLSNATKEEPIQ